MTESNENLSMELPRLASARAVRALRDIQKRERPDVLFLSETHLDKVKAEELRRKLLCDHCIIVESDGRSGGAVNVMEKGCLN